MNLLKLPQLSAVVFCFFSLFLVLGLPQVIQADVFAGGDGSSGNPYQIVDCTGLESIASTSLSDYYMLENDIDCSSDGNSAMIGSYSYPFSGDLNGGGHKITLAIDDPINTVGLFAALDGANIHDLWIAGSVTGDDVVGALAGDGGDSPRIGSTITRVFSSTNVSGSFSVGGLIGQSNVATLHVSDSYVTGSVSGSSWGVGGIIGSGQFMDVSNSYTTGAISGGPNIGGLAGLTQGSSFSNDFSVAPVSGASAGGLIGSGNGTTDISNSFWDSSASGQSDCFNGATPDGCTDETATSYFQVSTNTPYTVDASPVWDFGSTWVMPAGQYPQLRDSYGLIAYYPLDASDGIVASNVITGAGDTIQGNATPTWTTGAGGNALDMDGGMSFQSGVAQPTDALSVSLWFNASDLCPSEANPRLVADDHSDSTYSGFQLEFNCGGASGFFDVANGATDGFAEWHHQLFPNTWYNYVGTYDGSTVKAYLNGEQVASIPYSGSIAMGSQPIGVGFNPAYTGDFFKGLVDDVRVYNRALPASEVTANYSALSGNVDPPPTLYAGGSGTVDDPYQITTCRQLQNISYNNDNNSYFKIENDIYCDSNASDHADDTSTWNTGEGFLPISTFNGTLDGDAGGGSSYTIYGLYMNDAGANDVGLFGTIDGGTVQNIHFDSDGDLGEIDGDDYVGTVAGYLTNGTTTNVTSNMGISGSTSDIGGIIGKADGTDVGAVEVSHDTFTGTIALTNADGSSAVYDIGGIVGEGYGGNSIGFSYLTFDGRLDYENDSLEMYSIGGIGGDMEGTAFTNNQMGADATLFLRMHDGGDIGGLVGYANGLIGMGSDENANNNQADAGATVSLLLSSSDCTGGMVCDVSSIGGLFGGLDNTGITDSSFAGEVNILGDFYDGEYGGLVGITSGSTYERDSFSGTVTAESGSPGYVSAVGGLVGYVDYHGDGDPASNFSECVSTGSVEVTGTDEIYDIGGAIGGGMEAIIDQSYATTSVTVIQSTGNENEVSDIAGFVGLLHNSAITNSYAAGSISVTGSGDTDAIGADIAGFLGWSASVDLSDSYAAENITLAPQSGGASDNYDTVGGLVGEYTDGHLDNNFASSTLNVTSPAVAADNIGSLAGDMTPVEFSNNVAVTSFSPGTCAPDLDPIEGCTELGDSNSLVNSTSNLPFNDGSVQQWDFTTPIWDKHYSHLPTLDFTNISYDDDNTGGLGNDLVVYYPFDQANGDTLGDISGANRDGSLTGSPEWMTGKYGNALSFDGSGDQYAEIPADILNNLSAGTISVWVNLDSTDTGAILAKQHDGVNSYYLKMDNGHVLWHADNAAGDVESTATLTTGAWHHIVVTFTTSGTSLYIDGTFDTSASGDFSIPDDLSPTSSRLGSWLVSGVEQAALSGSIDDLRVYSRALTGPEVTALYDGIGLNMVGYWKMDEKSGTTLFDSSGLSNDMTVNGTSQWSFAEYDNGFVFDGATDAGTTSLSSPPGATMTICGWVNTTSTNDQVVLGLGRNMDDDNDGEFEIQANGDPLFWDHSVADGYGFSNTESGATTAVNDGHWHQICFVKEGTSGTYYVDGTSAGTVTAATNISYGSSNWMVGADAPSNDDFFTGKMDDLRVYNVALTAQEIGNLYAPESVDLDVGLSAYWPLDQATGDTVYDFSGNTNDGTVSGTSDWETGTYGNGFAFDGSSYVQTSYTMPDQDPTSSFTWSAWLYQTEGNQDNTVILGWRTGDHWIKLTPTQFEYYQGGLMYNTIPNGEWVLVTVVKDGSKITYYQNGEVMATATSTDSVTGNTFYMGEDPNYSADGTWNGEMDDVRIYNRALDPDEVRSLYGGGGIHLLGYWPMDEGSGLVAHDISGFGHDASVVGTTAAWTTGEYGSAFDFDGGTMLQTNLSLPVSAYTKSAWIYLNSCDTVNNFISSSNDSGTALWAPQTYGCELSAGTNGVWNQVQDSEPLNTGQWYFVSVTYDSTVSSGTLSLYLDGTLVDSATGVAEPGAADVYIGGHAMDNYIDGLIDDARVYDVALTSTEIADLHGNTDGGGGGGGGSGFDGSGSGTSDDPYQITTCRQLQEIDNNPSFDYVLENDIYCDSNAENPADDTSTWNAGAGFLPIGRNTPFSGSLDGENYTIYGLYINRPTEQYTGLFADVEDGLITDLSMDNDGGLGSIAGRNLTGSFAGIASGSTLTGLNTNMPINVSVSDAVDSVGGVAGVIEPEAGQNTVAYVTSYANITISCTNIAGCDIDEIGGIAGGFDGGDAGDGSTLDDFDGSITIDASTSAVTDVGGIAGELYHTSPAGFFVGAAFENPTIMINAASADKIGGVFGRGDFTGETVQDMEFTGDATLTIRGHNMAPIYWIGGIGGDVTNMTATDLDTEGTVSLLGSFEDGAYGGLFGVTNDSTVSNSYMGGNLIITDNGGNGDGLGGIGGLVGDAEGDAGEEWSQDHVEGTVAVGDGAPEDIGAFGGAFGVTNGTSVGETYVTPDSTLSFFSNGNVSQVGGFVGSADGLIHDSYAASGFAITIAGSGGSVAYSGGFAGESDAEIDNSYATGTVSVETTDGAESVTSNDIGGFMGLEDEGSILNNDFAASTITFGDTVGITNRGGFLGDMAIGTFSNDVFDQGTTGSSLCVGNEDASLNSDSACNGVDGDGTQPKYFYDTTTVAPYNDGSTQQWDFSDTPVWDKHYSHLPTLDFAEISYDDDTASHLSDGLVGYWPLDEIAGSTVEDFSGENNNGNLENSPNHSAGRFGNALDFSPPSSDLVISSSTTGIPVGNDAYTISAWFKDTDSTPYQGLIGWGGYGTDNETNALRLDSGSCPDNDGFLVYWWGNDLTACAGEINIYDGQWHNVVTEFDGTTRSVYLDNTLLASDRPTGHNTSTADDLTIGVTNNTEYFQGSIDDVRVYNRFLDTSDIKNIWESDGLDLAGYWNFDESSGDTAHETSGSGGPYDPNDGALNEGGTASWVSGVYGNAFSFDGSSYFTVNRPVQDDFSICSWVKTSGLGAGDDHWSLMQIMDAEVGGMANDFGFGIDADGHVAYGNGGGEDLTVNGSTTVNDNQWHFLCVTRDSTSGNVVLYVDGSQDATGSTDTGSMSDNPTALIGGAQDSGANFTGLMDDLRTYNVVLTSSQISGLYVSTIHEAFPGAGTGTSDDPYQITTCSELEWMNNDLSAHYELENDIDCGMTNPSSPDFDSSGEWADDKGFVPIGGDTDESNDDGNVFTGSFNGNEYTISDLYMNRPTEWYTGLFGNVLGGTVRNFTLEGPTLTGNYLGSAVGAIEDSESVQNINVIGANLFVGQAGTDDDQDYSGGVIAWVDGEHTSNLAHLTFQGNISSANASFVGGIIAYMYNSELAEAYTNGSITGSFDTAGGMVAIIPDSSSLVVNCYSTLSVAGEGDGTNEFGGLVGFNDSNIINSYATGNMNLTMSGENPGIVGGLVGDDSDDSSIINSFAVGGISGGDSSALGGLVGTDTGSEDNSYFYDDGNSGEHDQNNGSGTPLSDVTALYGDTHAVYDVDGDNAWDFSTRPVWDAHAGSYPTLHGVADIEPPSTPNGFTSSNITSSSVLLSWDPSTDNVGVDYYGIIRGGVVIATTTETSYTITGLSPSTSYVFRVRAYDFAGNSSGPTGTRGVTTLASSDVVSGSSGGGGVFIQVATTSSKTLPDLNSLTPADLSGLTVDQLKTLVGELEQEIQQLASLVSQKFASSTPTQVYQFSRDLKYGDTGPDVEMLQKFLNTHGFTLVTSGRGSPGHETELYSGYTLSAISAFQEAHAALILTPQGFKHGTGIFGTATRNFVNAMLEAGK